MGSGDAAVSRKQQGKQALFDLQKENIWTLTLGHCCPHLFIVSWGSIMGHHRTSMSSAVCVDVSWKAVSEFVLKSFTWENQNPPSQGLPTASSEGLTCLFSVLIWHVSLPLTSSAQQKTGFAIAIQRVQMKNQDSGCLICNLSELQIWKNVAGAQMTTIVQQHSMEMPNFCSDNRLRSKPLQNLRLS